MTLQEGDPREIGGYRLEGRLGAGGMGVVYLARSVSGRQVAVKVIRPELAEDPGFRERFRQEAAAARRVSGAFTAPVVDADPEAPAPWFATLFVPGLSLAQRVSVQGPLTVDEVRGLGAGLAEALRDIHRAGLVHRDLKPGNVLLAEDGPRVIDFGIARTSDAVALTSTGVAVGTPPFMAPEQFRREEVTPAADVFALGSVLVYAATGHGPFDGDTAHVVGFRVVYEGPDLTGLPPELGELVHSCLEKDPERRATVPRLLEVLAGAHGKAGAAAGTERGTIRTEQGTVPPETEPVAAARAVPAPHPATEWNGPEPGPATLPPASPASSVAQALAGQPTQAAGFRHPVPPVPATAPTPTPAARARHRKPLLLASAVALLAVVATAAVVVPDLLKGKGSPEAAGDGTRSGAGGTASAAPLCAPTGGKLRSAGAGAQKAAVQRWTEGYAKECGGSASIDYQPNGSGAALASLLARRTELAVSNVALTQAQQTSAAKRCGPDGVLQLPLNTLPIVVAVNIPGVSALNLDARTVADIFNGRVTRWNDQAVARLNPGVFLPAAPVTVVLPSGESPHTRTFTQYLSAAAPDNWPRPPSDTLATPSGTTAVTAKTPVQEVAASNGGITFLPLTEARGTTTTHVRLTPGPDAASVLPDADSTARTVALAPAPAVIGRGSLTLDYAKAARTDGTYPLVQLSYAVVCAQGNAPASLPALRGFLLHALSEAGQASTEREGYGVLPNGLADRVRKAVRDLG
ncbi:serine/threonine-protein kinase [Streptomyces sp. NBC_00237]|uniref:serine/threonine-protein kinase n=1 Tax=Streptomyces sp. NBC_00237 TaxID=2975687 RepID=UPI0022595E19|nr:serine/threonine-protein kinase [Streptomyces sp. NBC_00237]MCX5206542.1 serine/threonine-protein kinase [Streptomyces sp. NBC_00237]